MGASCWASCTVTWSPVQVDREPSRRPLRHWWPNPDARGLTGAREFFFRALCHLTPSNGSETYGLPPGNLGVRSVGPALKRGGPDAMKDPENRVTRRGKNPGPTSRCSSHTEFTSLECTQRRKVAS